MAGGGERGQVRCMRCGGGRVGAAGSREGQKLAPLLLPHMPPPRVTSCPLLLTPLPIPRPPPSGPAWTPWASRSSPTLPKLPPT